MSERLTPAAARALPPGRKLKDHECVGLELKAGAKRKSWSLYYRTKGGVERRPVIGHWPDIGIEAARSAARHILTEVAKGLDPAADWQAKRSAPAVWELWLSYHKHLIAKRRASTVAEYERQMKSVLEPSRLARMPVADVTLADVERWLDDVRARKFTGGHSPAKGRADKAGNRALAVLSGAFKHAELRLAWRPRGSNPCSCADRAPPGKRERYAEPHELQALGAFLREEWPANPGGVALVISLLFVGARTGELANARWTDFYQDRSILVVKDHKSARVAGHKEIYIPAPVAEIWRRLTSLNSPKIFGDLPGDPVRRLWEKATRAAGCPDLQVRDLRRTFASLGYNSDEDARTLQALLGHQNPETTRIYTVLFSEAKKNAADAIASRAAALIGGPGS